MTKKYQSIINPRKLPLSCLIFNKIQEWYFSVYFTEKYHSCIIKVPKVSFMANFSGIEYLSFRFFFIHEEKRQTGCSRHCPYCWARSLSIRASMPMMVGIECPNFDTQFGQRFLHPFLRLLLYPDILFYDTSIAFMILLWYFSVK